MYVGRFAPSPTGPLHFGSLVAALASWLDARAAGGRWLVRIEDLDAPRSRAGRGGRHPAHARAVGPRLGRTGALPEHAAPPHYRRALAALEKQTYWCGCTRREIADSALGLAADGAQIYPGTCRTGIAPGKVPRALRLRAAGEQISFTDRVQGIQAQRLDARSATSCCCARMDSSPISSRWWWTMPNKA